MDDKGLYKRHMEDRKGAEQTEAEVRVMLPQAKGCLRMVDRRRKRQRINSPLEPQERAQPCPQLDFGLLGSRTTRE